MSSGHNVVNFSETRDRGTSRGGGHHRPDWGWVEPSDAASSSASGATESILIGRGDQRRLGEALMPQVLGQLLELPRARCFGLVSEDQTHRGGTRVWSYAEGLAELQASRVNLLHYGGEILGLGLIEGYREAAHGEEADRFSSLAVFGERDDLLRYARRRTGQNTDLAYVLADRGEFEGASLAFHAVGLSDPGKLADSAQTHLLEILRRAEFVGVRDARGADYLEREGIAVERMPCGLTALPRVIQSRLGKGSESEALEAVQNRFPNGWIAVETSALREADLERLSLALRETADRESLGLVFFEANPRDGASSKRLRRWVDPFPEWQAAEFASANYWDMADLLMHSRLYCGSCLASRVICMAAGVPRINLPTDSREVESYCQLWEHEAVPVEFGEDQDWTEAMAKALAVDLPEMRRHAEWLQGRYLESLQRFAVAMGLECRPETDRISAEHERARERFHHLYDEWLQQSAASPATGGASRRSPTGLRA